MILPSKLPTTRSKSPSPSQSTTRRVAEGAEAFAGELAVEVPSVAAWLSTLFEPLPAEGEETEVDRELADLLDEPEVTAALYPRQLRALH